MLSKKVDLFDLVLIYASSKVKNWINILVMNFLKIRFNHKYWSKKKRSSKKETM